jgi:hypothetical protein
LPAMASSQSTLMLTALTLSLASQLPQGYVLKRGSGHSRQGAHLAVAVHQRRGNLLGHDQVLHCADYGVVTDIESTGGRFQT